MLIVMFFPGVFPVMFFTNLSFLAAGFVQVKNFFVACRTSAQRFARQRFDRMRTALVGVRRVWRSARGGFAVAMVIVFEVFEDVAHVEECITVQADVHESGLHAR